MKRTIGILGGMGPLATADLFRKITIHTKAQKDQEHPRVCIDSNTEIPDRTAALLEGGEGPLSELIKSAQGLQQLGAEVIIVPCNTAHAFLPQVQEAVDVPFLHMIDLTRDALVKRGIRKAGLLATTGTLRTGIYQQRFASTGIELLLPDEEDHAAIMGVIYDGVKAGNYAYDASAFRAVCEKLMARGAETLILGCTELPIAAEMYQLPYDFTDPTLELALGAIRFVGHETI